MKLQTIIFLYYAFFGYTSYSQKLYWEDLSKAEQLKVIDNSNINTDLLKFYNGQTFILDNDKTANKILAIVTENKRDSLQPFYFFVFNKICLSKNEAIAEILGVPCIKIILNDPNYVFQYLTLKLTNNDQDLLNSYVNYIGSELYFANEGLSESKYDYSSFKNILTKRSSNFTQQQKYTLNLFWKKIDDIIIKMD